MEFLHSDTLADHSRKVLLVDDEEPIILSLCNYLQHCHLDVMTATSGLQALDLVRTEVFDLVITDLAMSDMNGIELLSKIKDIKPSCGVFLLTGYGDLDSAVEAIRRGADDYLLKPCDIDELIFRMESFFQKQEALRKVRIYETFLPICMYCKKIRDDAGVERGAGRWMLPEAYLKSRNRDLKLSHGCCPECYEKHKGEWMEK